HAVPGSLWRVRLISVDLGIDDRHRESSSISLVSSVSQQVVRNDVKRLFVLDARTRGQFSALLGVHSKLRYGFHSASMARDNQWHSPIKSNLATHVHAPLP